jgi:spore coat protein CotH
MDIKLRRYYPAIVLLAVFLSSLLYVYGDTMIIPYTTDSDYETKMTTISIDNSVDILDDTVIHEIEIDLDRDDYESMIDTYEQTSLKEYYKTDIVIDGVTVEDVGVRLKGQLTLQQAFRGSSQIESMQLPLLIKFDEYEDGQEYEGITELAVRIGSSDALLEMPLALYAHSIAGAVVPDWAYASVTVSDLGPAYYVICEHIDESYLEKYFDDPDGVLYKAGNSVDLSYKGDDQTEYMDDFDQKTQVNVEDYAHMIEFLKFIDEASDEEFEEELPDRVDVDALITMMAVNDLVENSDSFSGMNSNYYLYYSSITENFTILAWDMNLAFGAMMQQGYGHMGGAFDNVEGGINRTGPGGGNMQQRPDMGDMGNFTIPEGMDAAMQGGMGNFTAGGWEMPDDQDERRGGDVERGERAGRASNALKERFFENENFTALYE